ncbi:MAG: hypothetical protein WA055_01365 [Candidatus Moraniibacteriota bacterium]
MILGIIKMFCGIILSIAGILASGLTLIIFFILREGWFVVEPLNLENIVRWLSLPNSEIITMILWLAISFLGAKLVFRGIEDISKNSKI